MKYLIPADVCRLGFLKKKATIKQRKKNNMHTLEVKEIEFDDFEKAGKNKNYPESGFYLRTVKANDVEQCDLVFIDKSTSVNYHICSKSIFNGLQKFPEKITEQPEVLTAQSAHPEPGFVSETFVLEFAKVLLKK